jgi:PAS domain S-box-containing protein
VSEERKERARVVELEQLRAELAELHDVLDTALDALVRTGVDGRIRFASSRITDLIGWRPSELIGQRGYDFIDRIDVERLRQHLSRVRAADFSDLPVDLRLRHRDGSTRWAQVSFRAQRDVTGRLRGYVGHYRELSSQATTEIALRRSPEWLGLVSALGGVEYVVVCADDRLTTRSDGFAALLGFPPGELPVNDMRDWMRYVRPEDQSLILHRMALAAIDPQPAPMKFQLIGHDGRRRTILSRVVYTCGADGELRRVTAVMRDVTDALLVEQELRERSRLLQGVLDDLPDAVLQMDHELRVQYASPSCQRVFGLRPEQLLGVRISELWPDPAGSAQLDVALGTALRHKQGGELDLVLGQLPARRYIQLRYALERGSVGESDTLLALARDVTSLKTAELKARSAAERLQRMLDSTDFGVLMCDHNERISFANRRIEQLFGYRSGELIGLPFATLLSAEAARAQPERNRQRRAGHSAVFELDFRRQDHGVLRCRVNAMPLYNEAGEFEGSLGFWTDLSEREQAQHRARRLADRLTYLLETVGEGIAFLDPDGKVMFANARLERMLGVSVGALIGQPVPFELPALAQLVAAPQRMQEFNTQVLRADGSALPCSVRLRAAADEAGVVEGVIATLMDNSAERKGRDAIKRLGRLLETAGEGVCFTNAHDEIEFANRKLEQLLGFAPGTMVGIKDEMLLPPEFRGSNRQRVSNRRSGTGESYELQLCATDGVLVPCDINVTPLFDESGHFEGNLTTIIDLSQREQLRLEARSTTEWLEAALASAGIGSFDVDLASDVVRTAGLVRTLYGEPFSFDRWLNHIAVSDRAAVSQALNEVQHGKPARVEFRDAGSTERWFFGVLNVVSASPDTVQRVIGTLIDVTELKTLERERSALHAQISQSQRQESLGLLAGGVAHDFNNLLTSAVGHLELVKLSAVQQPELIEGLELVDQALVQMAALASQLQMYSGKGQVSFRTCDLNAAARDILAILKVSAGKFTQLQLELAGEALTLLGDATQLQQILMNLTINAAESMGTQGGTISIRTGAAELTEVPAKLRSALSAERLVYLEVADTGPGMPEDIQARIFEPFFSSKSNGRGLGLAVVVGAVKAHRGVIAVQSTLGVGTTFRIWLPRSNGELQPVGASTAQKGSTRTLKGTVLLIDDEEPVRSMVRRALLLRGLKVIEGSDGEQALSLLAEHPQVDVVVMDIIMPKLSGVDAYLRMRSDGIQVPVILMSGYAERSQLDRLAPDPPQALLRKPFKPAELYEQLERLLSAHRIGAA